MCKQISVSVQGMILKYCLEPNAFADHIILCTIFVVLGSKYAKGLVVSGTRLKLT